MTLRDDLIAAKAHIDTPERWCKGSYHNVGAHDAHCIIGAVRATLSEWNEEGERRQRVFEAIDAVLPEAWQRQHPDGYRLAEFNDNHEHADIMALFDRAIEAAS